MRTVDAAEAVKLPPHVSDVAAAALMLKGITAQYLMHDLGRAGPGMRVLVHAAAGGVGQLAASWARALGATVIGTVGSEAKAGIAREQGCERVIVMRDGPGTAWADAVLEATGGRGADLILDGIGAGVRDGNMRCLAMRGHWVAFGHSSGAMEPVPADWLGSRSATFSRPVVFHYTAEPGTLARRAGLVFDALASGALRWREPTRYPLAAAATAHADLEARRSTGAIVLLP
jgi:NADPH:quinone reductase-like Zn-dependent oxidoreductase